MATFTNQKFAIDLLISIVATVVLTTTILSVSTNHWSVKYEHEAANRTGLFQQCTGAICCDRKELDRTITLLALLSVVLLAVGALSSFILMAVVTEYGSRYYSIVPLTLFGSGITMTLTLIQVLDRIDLNGYSAFIFMIDTLLAYILGGISLSHATTFYF